MSVKRNTAYTLAASLLPIPVGLLAVPILLKLIGPERYGVLALAWALLGYFSIFDLGLTKATAQRVASLVGAPQSTIATTFWSALAVNAATGVLGGLVLYFAADLVFSSYMKLAPEMRAEMLRAVPILAATVPLSTISGVLSGALVGRERFLEINVASVASTVLGQLAPIAAAYWFSPDLTLLIASVVVARLLPLAGITAMARLHVFGGHPVRVERGEVRALLGFGSWVTVSGLIGPLMTILDRFVIGALRGPVAVTTYTIPWQLAQRSMMLPAALQSALFPRQAGSSTEEQDRLTWTGTCGLAVTMTPIMVLGIFIMEPFLKIWIGAGLSREAAEVGRIVLLGFWANGIAYVPFSLLEARGNARTGALVHVAEIVPYLLLLFFLMPRFGLAGAATAFSVRCAVDAAIFNVLALGKGTPWRIYALCALLLGVSVIAAANSGGRGLVWGMEILLAFGLAVAMFHRFAPKPFRLSVRALLDRVRAATS